MASTILRSKSSRFLSVGTFKILSLCEIPIANEHTMKAMHEEEGGALLPPTEVYENGFKILTEHKYNQDNKICINKIKSV